MLKSKQKVDIKLSKIRQSHQKLRGFTLHWNCCEDSRKCRRRFKLFVGLFVNFFWILLNKGQPATEFKWHRCWFLQTVPGFADFAGVVEITRLNSSEFLYYLAELYGNELVFAFSSVTSNNTNVETSEQFIILHTRCVCDFSGLTNFSQKLWNSKKTLINVIYIGFS